MTAIGSNTLNDINGQTEAWCSAATMLKERAPELRAAWDALDIDAVHITGCGSVNYLAQTVAPLLQSATGLPCSADPGAAFLGGHQTPVAHPDRTLLLTASRSGETTEVLEAVAAFRAAGGREVWCITTRSESSLAGIADMVVSDDEGFEPSVVQTRSFSSLLAMAQGLVQIIGGQTVVPAIKLDTAGPSCLAQAEAAVNNLTNLEELDRVIYLSTRTGFGLAQEGQLLMSEMALTDSAAHQLLDFRHGPISMVDERTLVVALLEPSTTERESAVLDDVARFGGTVLTLSMGLNGPVGQPTVAVDPDQLGYLPLLLPAMQLLAHRRAVVRAIDPDQPRNLSAVVILDGAG